MNCSQCTSCSRPITDKLCVPVFHDNLIDTEMVKSIRKSSRHDGIRDCHYMLGSLRLEDKTNRSRMQMAPVADHLCIDILILKHCSKNRRFMLMQKSHRISHMGRTCRPICNRPTRCLIICSGMSDCDCHSHFFHPGDRLNHALNLRRHRDVTDIPSGALLILL